MRRISPAPRSTASHAQSTASRPRGSRPPRDPNRPPRPHHAPAKQPPQKSPGLIAKVGKFFSGLFGKPTIINNVISLASVPIILDKGAEAGNERLFITENYVIPNDDVNALISYGLRFFGEKLSVDLAFWNSPQDMLFPGIPYVAFSVKF